jgi:Fic family protein
MNKEEKEFLENSNWIEREYSEIAMEDSIHAWNFAKRHSHDINLDYIKGIHKELMINLNPRIAGCVRKCPVYVGDRECLGFKKIEEALKYWIKAYSKVKKDFEIKEAHKQFERIHPFEDGNGRVGRIIMNIQRLNANLPLIIIHEGEEQLNYYKWFG